MPPGALIAWKWESMSQGDRGSKWLERSALDGGVGADQPGVGGELSESLLGGWVGKEWVWKMG